MSEPISAEEIRSIAEADTFAEFGAGTVLALLDEVDRLTEALEGAERVRVIQYQHEAVCDWVTNNSWCNCGLDEAWEKAVQTEAHHAATRLLAENETLTARAEAAENHARRERVTQKHWHEKYLAALNLAERAEADLADEKRRRAGKGLTVIDRAAIAHAIECYSGPDDDTVPVLRALLDTATEEAQGAP